MSVETCIGMMSISFGIAVGCVVLLMIFRRVLLRLLKD